jgi:hypothetical protein
VEVRRAPPRGYLADVDYFEREIAAEEEENDQKDADEDGDEDEDVTMAQYDHDDGGPAWDPETQPPDITEDEAIAMALANSELNELAMWDGLTIQIREAAFAQGRPATPPATPTRSNQGRSYTPATRAMARGAAILPTYQYRFSVWPIFVSQ